jgi:ankyrin repeat protein
MRRRNVVGLFLLLLLVGLVSIPVWLTYREIQQDRLNRALIAAIQRRDVSTALAALDTGADPNSRDADTSKPLSFWQSLRRLFAGMWRPGKPSVPVVNQNALILALDFDWTDGAEPAAPLSPLIRALVARRANVNVSDEKGFTPLILAVVYEPADTVHDLLDKGAEVNARDADGQTALYWAAKLDKVGMVKDILAHGADVNARDNSGQTALMQAALVGATDTVMELRAHGADVNARDAYGRTALMSAKARGGDTATISLLKQAGVKE